MVPPHKISRISTEHQILNSAGLRSDGSKLRTETANGLEGGGGKRIDVFRYYQERSTFDLDLLNHVRSQFLSRTKFHSGVIHKSPIIIDNNVKP